MRRLLACLTVLSGLLAAHGAAVAQEVEALVSQVRVSGNLRVEEGLILSKVSTRADVPYDAAQVREDIQAIYALGYFEDIRVELDDAGVVTFVVVERPALREWRAEDADELDKEDLEAAVPLKRREILTQDEVERGTRGIRDLYREKGYYLAEVVGEVIPVPDGKNQVDVVYRVTEGRKVRIKDINLIGVEKVERDGVRSYMAMGEAGAWSWITSSGTFKEADLSRDRDAIRAYYLNQGYVEAEVLDPLVSFTIDRRWLKVDIPIREGEQYRIGEIRFSGDLEFPEEQLREAAGLTPGEIFRSDDFRKGMERITDLYADIGYAFVDVDPKTRLDKEALLLNADLVIHKGDLVHLGRIEVRGNTKTRDRIVRREMRLAEGELYNATALKKSRQKIQNLGFFESVNVSNRRRPGTDLVDIDIEVAEKPTGAFSFGAGYSSVDKIIGMVSVSQRNFLGYGYQTSLQANFGSSRESYDFTFNNPRVFDSDIYAGTDLYKAIREYATYNKKSLGGALKLGTALGEEWRTRLIYRLEEANVRVPDPDGVSLFVRAQKGTTVTSSLNPILTYDTRDNPWEPHAGMTADLSVEWAGGVLGGDAQFIKYGFNLSRYLSLWFDHVLNLRGNIGFIQPLEDKGLSPDEEIPIYERYFLGGINSLRGFNSRSVGPTREVFADHDDNPATPDVVIDDEVVGGDKQLLFNAEYLFPLIPEAKVRGLFFFDAGNAWDKGERYGETPLRRSAGAGVRWFSPMGPLRLEWGYVLDRQPGEDPSQWEFSIGGFF